MPHAADLPFVIYDTETTGADPRFDAILQFGAVFCDCDFNELEAVDIRSKCPPHILPSPEALAVTNIDPHDLAAAPFTPFRFALEIHDRLSSWSPAWFTGYNSLRFDEEIIRQTFWQALLNPYLTNTGGSRRTDFLLMIQAVNGLRPDVLRLRINPQTGNPTLRLEIMAPDHGFGGFDAHDALADVRATAFMAKYLRDHAPTPFQRMLDNADPKHVEQVLARKNTVCLTHFGRPRLQRVVAIATDPFNPKGHLCFDLANDPTPFLAMAPEDLATRLDNRESPFQRIRANAQPAVFDYGDDVVPDGAITLDPGLAEERRRQLLEESDFAQRITAARRHKGGFPKSQHVEEQIYDGFAPHADKERMRAFHATDDWNERFAIACSFEDRRLKDIAVRIFWSTAPEVLPAGLPAQIRSKVVESRFLATGDVKWNTLASLEAELASERVRAHPLAERIKDWVEDIADGIRAEHPAAYAAWQAARAAAPEHAPADDGAALAVAE